MAMGVRLKKQSIVRAVSGRAGICLLVKGYVSEAYWSLIKRKYYVTKLQA
jgi:hypothetical protein